MAITSGFFNSSSGDRKYNAVQMGSIFDGVILDGVYMSIGDRFIVKTMNNGMSISVGSGRGWFKRTWILNDSEYLMNARMPDALLDRIDAVVIEVDIRDHVRDNTIKWVYGEPSSAPQRPILLDEPYTKQYPLAYIDRFHGTTEVLQEHITNMVGTDTTPYVTGPLETISASALLARWSAEWSSLRTQMQDQKTEQKTEWEEQTRNQQLDWGNQQIDWQSRFDAMQDQWGSWIGAAIADPANYFQRNFDNPAMYIGSTRWKTRISKDATIEEIRAGRLENGSLAASRVITRRKDGADIEYIFYDLLNGTIISQFIEHFDRITKDKCTNWIEGVM